MEGFENVKCEKCKYVLKMDTKNELKGWLCGYCRELPEHVYVVPYDANEICQYLDYDNFTRYKNNGVYTYHKTIEDVPKPLEVESEIAVDDKPDMVNSPPHYQSESGIECIDAIVAALGKDGAIAYCRGNVIKYSWRIKNPHEDMAKSAWYSNKANELLNC